MSMYTLEELLKRWQLGTLTVEQMIGQFLQHLLAMQKQIKDLKAPPTPPAAPKT